MRAPMECWRPEANRHAVQAGDSKSPGSTGFHHAHARLKGPVFQAPDPPSSSSAPLDIRLRTRLHSA